VGVGSTLNLEVGRGGGGERRTCLEDSGAICLLFLMELDFFSFGGRVRGWCLSLGRKERSWLSLVGTVFSRVEVD